MEKKRFREILACLNLPTINKTLAYSVKQQYMKYLHSYEIKNKDVLLKQWKTTITLPDSNTTTPKSETPSVPTIALNDSFRPDMKSQTNPTQVTSPHTDPSNWNQTMFSSSSATTTTTTPESSQSNSQTSFPSSLPSSQAMPSFSTSGMSGYSSPDLPSGYPGYGPYPNHMFPRGGPIQNFNTMRPNINNENIPGAWPRGFPPRQGPPELFPEGLTRMPWNQNPQRHPGMSAFNSPSFPGNKPKGGMPPISRDSMEQLKFNAQQQTLKIQQFQQQQEIQKRRFNTPEAAKIAGKVPPTLPTIPDVRPAITPAQPIKREFNFPAGSVECTKPTLKKRKKLTSKELGKKVLGTCFCGFYFNLAVNIS